MGKLLRWLSGYLFADPRALRRFRKNRGATFGLVLVVLVTSAAAFGPLLAPHDPDVQHLEELLHEDGLPYGPGESPGHLLGADTMGRDELSRLLYGGAVSMQVAFFATGLAVFIGLMVGLSAGYFGGAVDAVLMRLVDVLLSLPFLLIVIAVQRVIDRPDLWVLFLILGGSPGPPSPASRARRRCRCASSSTCRRRARSAWATDASSFGTCCRTCSAPPS